MGLNRWLDKTSISTYTFGFSRFNFNLRATKYPKQTFLCMFFFIATQKD